MTSQEILNTRNENGAAVISQGDNWLATSKDGLHAITFYAGVFTFTVKDDLTRFYKNEKSWAKRVSQLLRRGY